MTTHRLSALLAMLLVSSLTCAAEARTLECRTTDGVYRSPGVTTLAPAAKRDPHVVGSTFIVESNRANVAGSTLFRTEGQKVEVLKDSEDAFELLWRNEHQDVKMLRLAKFEGNWTFAYYSSWLGLLLTGHCREI